MALWADFSGAKKGAPPKAEKLVDFHSDVVKKVVSKYPRQPLVLAGKSMGSRFECKSCFSSSSSFCR